MGIIDRFLNEKVNGKGFASRKNKMGIYEICPDGSNSAIVWLSTEGILRTPYLDVVDKNHPKTKELVEAAKEYKIKIRGYEESTK
jgi:hypothetical protein